jgi:hypothetical protein
MSNTLIHKACPHCGEQTKVDATQETAECSWCNQPLRVFEHMGQVTVSKPQTEEAGKSRATAKKGG